MSTDYRIATKAVYPSEGFLVECWILRATKGQESATIIETVATVADNALEAEYYGLLAALKKAMESCEGDAEQYSLEIVPQHEDIGHQLLNRHTIDSVSLYHLRAKVFDLMSKFKFVSIGWKEQ